MRSARGSENGTASAIVERLAAADTASTVDNSCFMLSPEK
jgi:hypothetical protein